MTRGTAEIICACCRLPRLVVEWVGDEAPTTICRQCTPHRPLGGEYPERREARLVAHEEWAIKAALGAREEAHQLRREVATRREQTRAALSSRDDAWQRLDGLRRQHEPRGQGCTCGARDCVFQRQLRGPGMPPPGWQRPPDPFDDL